MLNASATASLRSSPHLVLSPGGAGRRNRQDKSLKRSMEANMNVFYIRAFPHALLVPSPSNDGSLVHCVLPTDRGLSMTRGALLDAAAEAAGTPSHRPPAPTEEELRNHHGPPGGANANNNINGNGSNDDDALDIDQTNSFQFLWAVFSRALAEDQQIDVQLVIRWKTAGSSSKSNSSKTERRKIFGRLDDVDVKMGLPPSLAASHLAHGGSSSVAGPQGQQAAAAASPLNSMFPMYFAITFPSVIVKALSRVPGFGYGRALEIEEIRVPRDLMRPLRLQTNRHVSLNQAVLFNGDFLKDNTYFMGQVGVDQTARAAAEAEAEAEAIRIRTPFRSHEDGGGGGGDFDENESISSSFSALSLSPASSRSLSSSVAASPSPMSAASPSFSSTPSFSSLSAALQPVDPDIIVDDDDDDDDNNADDNNNVYNNGSEKEDRLQSLHSSNPFALAMSVNK